MIFNLPVKTFRVDPTLYDKEQIISRITDNYALDPNRNVKPDMGPLHHCYVDYGNPKFNDPDYTKLAPVYQTLVEKYWELWILMKEPNIHGSLSIMLHMETQSLL